MVQADEHDERADHFRRMFDDPVALRSWFDETFPVLYGFVFARCGGVEAVAQDVTQDTMLEVVRHRRDFDGRAAPLTWVCGIARHKVADHFRKQHREERRRVRLVEEQSVAPEAVEAPEASETPEAVIETLHALPEAQRVVLAMHYLDGLPVKDIARELDRSETSVASLLARGRQGFRRAWSGEEGTA